jgi:hypothetical protein
LLRFSAKSLAGCLLLSYLTYAADGGSVSGTVTDQTGGRMPGVPISIRDTATGGQRTTVTSTDGFYAFPTLSVGSYDIEIDRPGYKPYRHPAVRINSNSAVRVDVTLELGARSETVEVNGTALQVETADTQMGQTVSGHTVSTTPLNGRSFTDLLALQPGVVPISSQQPNAVVMGGVTTSLPPSGDLNAGNLSIGGQRETANGFMVNGSDVEEDVNMGTSIIPNLDSIAEFRILASNFDAEYGNYSGGQILVVTKSGANQYHGSVFDYLRNTDLDARNFFSSQRARYQQNQFGGTFGGPVRRNKIFVFADYQGTRLVQGIDTGLITVPSLADRTGNLSDLASSLTGAVSGSTWAQQLSQRLGYKVSPGESYYTAGCVVTTQCVFPNANIPQSAWSIPAKNLLRYIPPSNHGTNVFSSSAYNENLQDDKGALRLDSDSRWGMLSLYYFADGYSLNNPYPTAQGGANVPGFNAVNTGRAQLVSLSETKSFGATTVNELHLSFMRNANQIGQPVGGVGPTLASQGFTNIVPLAPAIEGVENMAFNDYTIGVDTTGLTQVNNTYQWIDNLSKVIGAHTLKFGGEFHIDQVNTNPDSQYNGSFLFQGTETGSDFADFLLGVASSYTQNDAQSFYIRNRYAGLFAQDSWRLTSNLTLNYGLRWDRISPWSEKYNQLQTLVLGEQSEVYPGAPTGLVFPGDPGVPNSLASTRNLNFSPRVGIAYSPAASSGFLGRLLGGPGNTSIRAGYGMFYTAFEGLSAGIMSANPPFGSSYTSPAPPLVTNPFVTAASGQNYGQPFPLPHVPFGATPQNPDATIDWSRYEPLNGIPAFAPGNQVPYSENYVLSIERKLGASTLASASYAGSQAHHLLALVEANPGNAALCLTLSQPANLMPGTASCGPFGESGTYTTASGQVIQGTRQPFPAGFGSVGYQKTMANSNYNALELSLRHTSGPLELMAGYTFSKSVDQSSSLSEPLNPLNYALTRAPSAFDMKHNFVASLQYAPPFARWSHISNPWTQGWSLSVVSRFSSGLPVTLYNNNDTSLLGTIPNAINNNGIDTPNYAPGNLDLHLNPRSSDMVFNTSLFTLPALGQLGTTDRRFFYGPGIENIDLALLKDLKFAESRSLQFRLETFNTFNHAQFYGAASVDGNITSADFGRVISAAAPRLAQVALKFSF